MLIIFLFLIAIIAFILWSFLRVASLCDEEEKGIVKK